MNEDERARTLGRLGHKLIAPFVCISCHWAGELRFTEEEHEGLGGNVEKYTGPCPGCKENWLIAKADLVQASKTVVNFKEQTGIDLDVRLAIPVLAATIREKKGSTL